MADIHNRKSEWAVSVQSLEMPAPGGFSDKAKLDQIKTLQELKYPRKAVARHIDTKNNEIQMTHGFTGNNYVNKVPNDNSIAISNEGYLISFINSSYYIYNTANDSLMDFGYIDDFIQGLNLTASKYDPKVTFDPVEEKFVMVFLIGTNASKSKIALSFSTTSNPIDPWNTYILEGDALQTGHWTDYPAIALSEKDFFITGNLLADNQSWQTGFRESIIWQINKADGFSGLDSVRFSLWSDIKDNNIKIRNIHPVKGGQKLFGPNQYFLSNKNFSAESDTVYLIEISNSYESGTAGLTLQLLHLDDHYFMSPNGRQYISKKLATNDSRVLGAIRSENTIQYVHNCMDTTFGTAGIYHGIIHNFRNDPQVEGYIFSDSIMDFGYPNIASTGIDSEDFECLVGFNFTSPVDTNGVACFYFNNEQTNTGFKLLKRGNSAISVLSGTVDRWGDYFGIQRKFNEPCKVWLGGMFSWNNKNSTWLSEVSVSDTCRTPTPILVSDSTDTTYNFDPAFTGKIFPNPSRDLFYIDFEMQEEQVIMIEILGPSGTLVKHLFEDKVNKGKNRLSFDPHFLSSGVYFIRIFDKEKVIQTYKFIKN